MIVIDSSAMVEALLRRGPSHNRTQNEWLCAPHLLDAEVTSALRSEAFAGVLDAAAGRRAIARFVDMDILRYEHICWLPRAWELRHNLSAYDAIYVALAEDLGVPLVTTDARLAAAPGVRATVEVLALGA